MDTYKKYTKNDELFSSLDITFSKTKHSTEAKNAGLFLVGKSENKDLNYKNYLCLTCGACADFQVTHVRRGHVTCQNCLSLDYKSRGVSGGFSFIRFTDKKGFAIYRREACGHELEISLQAIGKRIKRNKGDIAGQSCSYCHEAHLIESAEKRNMTLLGAAKTKGGVYRHYMFNDCGHTRDIHAGCIDRGNFFCSECKEDRYAEDARCAGLTYLGFASKKAECKRLYQLPCGHTKEIRMDHAKDGSYLCDKCGDSHYTKPSSIYLLKMETPDGFSWLKLGYSKSLAIRKNNYGLSKGCEVTLLCTVDVVTGALAVNVEKGWHKLLKPLRLSKSLMKNYHRFNGFTECYSVQAEGEILALMNELRKGSNE